MSDVLCTCIYKTFMGESASPISTTLDLLLTVIIGISGLIINYTFVKKLREEKRNTPLGRKGNVIEPIMRWFCFLQMFYWPYHLTFFWLSFNGILSAEMMNGLQCSISMIGIRMGRICISFNSLFVALIRYIYIVHNAKANQWNFENVGKLMQISSIIIPVCFETFGVFVHTHTYYQTQEGFPECIADNLGLNTTEKMKIPDPYLHTLTTQLLPQVAINIMNVIYGVLLMVVLSNLVECFLYFRIHQSIQK